MVSYPDQQALECVHWISAASIFEPIPKWLTAVGPQAELVAVLGQLSNWMFLLTLVSRATRRQVKFAVAALQSRQLCVVIATPAEVSSAPAPRRHEPTRQLSPTILIIDTASRYRPFTSLVVGTLHLLPRSLSRCFTPQYFGVRPSNPSPIDQHRLNLLIFAGGGSDSSLLPSWRVVTKILGTAG